MGRRFPFYSPRHLAVWVGAFTLLVGAGACAGSKTEGPATSAAAPQGPAVAAESPDPNPGRRPGSTSTPSLPSSAPKSPLPPVIADLHVDTVTAIGTRSVSWRSPDLEASLPALQAAGVNVVVQAAWIPRGDPNPRGTALGKLRRIRNMVLQSGHVAAIVTGPAQLEAVLAEGRIAVVLALEGGTALTEGRETLDELRALGLSMVGPTWSESSAYADSSSEPRAEGGGLTDKGRALVRWSNELGLMIDVSHMSDRATAETIAVSKAPVLASHSNAKALCDVPRNLNDELLLAIAKKGGLVGAMFHGPFVVAGREAKRADVVRQINALVDRIGANHVGIGSDFDGIIQAPDGLKTSADLGALWTDLRRGGLSAQDLRWIQGESFLRYWRAVTAASGPS